MISNILHSLFPKYENTEFIYWINISYIKSLSCTEIETRLLQISKIRNKGKKIFILDEFIDSLTSELIDNSGCNCIIFNLPDVHNTSLTVTDETIYETFVPYGPIFAVHKYNDIAYIWFIHNSHAKFVSESIDNMECENNILQSQYTESNSIINKYDWITNCTYKTYNVKNIILNVQDIEDYWKTIV